MDPAGLKFLLSRNLLQLDGADIIIAADLLDAVSDLARHQMVTGSPRFGTDFLHLLLADGIRQVLPPRVLEKDVEEELDSLCKGIGRVLDDTLITLCRTGSYRSPTRLNLPGYRTIYGRPGGQRSRCNRRG
jgi:hypothetical protein